MTCAREARQNTMASLFAQLGAEYMRNLELLLHDKPAVKQEDVPRVSLRDENGRAFLHSLRCSVDTEVSSHESDDYVSRMIEFKVSQRSGEDTSQLMELGTHFIDNTFQDMCNFAQEELCNREDRSIGNILSMIYVDPEDGIQERRWIVTFKGHFGYVKVSSTKSESTSLNAMIMVYRFKYTAHALEQLAYIHQNEFSYRFQRMDGWLSGPILSLHVRLKNYFDRRATQILDKASVNILLRGCTETFGMPSLLLQPPFSDVEKNCASFHGWDAAWKRKIAEYVHNSAFLDFDSFHRLQESMRTKKHWVAGGLLKADVSVYSSGSMWGKNRGEGVCCQYMVPLGIDERQVEFTKRVLAADVYLQERFVLDSLLDQNDPRILKMFVHRTKNGDVFYLALFKTYGAVAHVFGQDEEGWYDTWGDNYHRLCTGMQVTTFPYDERNIQNFRNQYARPAFWQPVDIGHREGAEQVPNLLAETWPPEESDAHQNHEAVTDTSFYCCGRCGMPCSGSQIF